MIRELINKLCGKKSPSNEYLLLTHSCQTCNGNGRLPATVISGPKYLPERMCRDCNGTGRTPRFQDNELFCKKCLTHEYFWVGGGSSTPDECPCTSPESTEVLVWRKMDHELRIKAAEQFEDMWNRKFSLGKYSLDHAYNVIGRETKE